MKGWPSLALALLLAGSPVAADGLLVDASIIVAGQGADLWSTEHKLARGHQELVGPSALGGTSGRAALKVALSAGVVAGCQQLRKRGHKRQARLLAILVGGLGAGFAAWNMSR